MPSKRYIICKLPLEHINGKFANTKEVVHNTYNPELNATSFLYGYRNKYSNCTRFAMRVNPRNLNTNPYTQAETTQRQLFSTSLQVVREKLQIEEEREKALQAFRQQAELRTLFGFCVSRTYHNGGKWFL